LGVILDERIPNMAVVRDVYEGSPAEEMGLRAGDTIWSVNGQQIRSPSELSQSISQLPPGEEVDIRYSRPEVREVEVTLDAQRGNQ
jgi:serine protease Do